MISFFIITIYIIIIYEFTSFHYHFNGNLFIQYHFSLGKIFKHVSVMWGDYLTQKSQNNQIPSLTLRFSLRNLQK